MRERTSGKSHPKGLMEKEGHFMAFLLSTIFTLFVGVFVQTLFRRWCKEHHLSVTQGVVLLLIVLFLIGLTLLVFMYIFYLLSRFWA